MIRLKKETNNKEILKPYPNDEKRPHSEIRKTELMKNKTQQLTGFKDLQSLVLFFARLYNHFGKQIFIRFSSLVY